MADVLPITGDPAQDEPSIARAAALLRAGGIVGIPTETVYGLAGNALDPAAIAKIYAAKGRPSTNPLIVHVTSVDDAKALASMWPESAARLAEAFWPGPLTLIVPKASHVPDAVTAGFPSVALRVPAHPVMRAVIDAAGVPLAAPSANRSQALSPTRAGHVLKSLGDRIELILDAGTTEHGLESTVVDCTVTPPRILRPGPIARAALERIVGTVKVQQGSVDDATPRLSPGMSARHYAPQARLLVVPGAALARTLDSTEGPVGVFLLGSALPRKGQATVVQMPADPVAYGAALYIELHRMDDQGIQTIIVEEPPREAGWEAVRDRLGRASA